MKPENIKVGGVYHVDCKYAWIRYTGAAKVIEKMSDDYIYKLATLDDEKKARFIVLNAVDIHEPTLDIAAET